MASLSSAAGELTAGERLPELRGEYLSGRKALLPDDAAGRTALLMFGFTYRSRFAVEEWTKRFRADFERNSQVTFYEIPMIGGSPVWANGSSTAACGAGLQKPIMKT
jgi:hypothetical protein